MRVADAAACDISEMIMPNCPSGNKHIDQIHAELLPFTER